MKRIAILAVIAAVVVTGCNKKTDPEPVADVLVDEQRPSGRVTSPEEPAKTELTDAEIDTILAATADTETVDVSPIRPAPAAGTTHVVRKGDTLWSLAVRYLGDGQRWRDIVGANPGVRPERLAVGQTLNIPAR